uniref:Exocyst complex component 1 like n=1 Tax=Laticauda laticaudata TaxID=8630 RepID=A0A8C5S263_LATLA
MSSLLKEDLNKKLFKSQGQNLYGFIEIECSGQDRFYLCASVSKGEEVQISVVKHNRSGLDENYEISEKWLLNDLEMIDGKEADSVSAAFYYKACILLLLIRVIGDSELWVSKSVSCWSCRHVCF